jgi:hypothetical protein
VVGARAHHCPRPKPSTSAELVAAHDRFVHSDRADDRRASLRPRVRQPRQAAPAPSVNGQSRLPMAPRDIPSSHGEDFLYDFKGGSLRSPPAAPRGLRALASSRPRPRGRPSHHQPPSQVAALSPHRPQLVRLADTPEPEPSHRDLARRRPPRRSRPALGPCSRRVRPDRRPDGAPRQILNLPGFCISSSPAASDRGGRGVSSRDSRSPGLSPGPPSSCSSSISRLAKAPAV